MVNRSKINERYWSIWKSSGAVGTVEDAKVNLRKKEQLRDMEEAITNKLKCLNLTEKIIFHDAALKELFKISGGYWGEAKLYVGLAVCNAIFSDSRYISRKDIKNVDIIEGVKIVLSGMDVFEVARNLLVRFGSVSENSVPEQTMYAFRPYNIQYRGGGLYGPELYISFGSGGISKKTLEDEADALASYVTQRTGAPHVIRDVSLGNKIQYFVQPETPVGENPIFTEPLFRVKKGLMLDELCDGVIVSSEPFCRDKDLLKSYYDVIAGLSIKK